MVYNNGLTNKKPDYFNTLKGREKQFQRFLFYRYFYGNEKPLIVTEGKTDIIYLKAALKKLYADYPNLVVKKDNGKYDFKVSFLTRSERLSHFLGLSKDGADAMKNIYMCYTSKKHGLDFSGYSYTKCGKIPSQPVILIFDNELDTKTKPLNTFASYIGLSDNEKDVFKQRLTRRIFAECNLFLLTHPLAKDVTECEIEDLFTQETLNQKIGGKTFCRDEKMFDKQIHYGKEIFSKHIYSNYVSIDYSGFKDFLDTINLVITEYDAQN